MISGVLFDHDGTVVDSLQVVVEATNRALAAHGYPSEPARVIIASMVHPTAPRMGLHARVEDPGRQRELAQAFIQESRRLGFAHTKPYPGIAALVEALALRPVALGLVSNNDSRFIQQVMTGHGFAPRFRVIYGEQDMPAPKPDPRGLVSAAAALGQEVGHCVYVGDSGCDAHAGHAAGMRTIGVTWGIHTRAQIEDMGFDWIIDSPGELLAILDRDNAAQGSAPER